MYYKGNQRQFAIALRRHPLIRSSLASLTVAISLIIGQKTQKPSLHFIAAVEDITKGMVGWIDWLELLEPEYVHKRKYGGGYNPADDQPLEDVYGEVYRPKQIAPWPAMNFDADNVGAS
jgi:hypothetical protein